MRFHRTVRALVTVAVLGVAVHASPAVARPQTAHTRSAPATPASNPLPQLVKNPEASSLSWSIVVLLSLLTLLPTLLMAMTPFTRFLIVFHFLRQAIGTQTTPTNQIMIGLALILTFFVMQPVVTQIYTVGVEPFQAGTLTAMQAVDKGSEPLRNFMLHFTREKDLALFVEIARQPRPQRAEDLPMRIVAPAYVVSELRTGFQIGMVLFLPFLVIDMVVASITTSIGMMQLPPVVISTPLKIMLFVMVDGWSLLIGSLVKSFY